MNSLRRSSLGLLAIAILTTLGYAIATESEVPISIPTSERVSGQVVDVEGDFLGRDACKDYRLGDEKGEVAVVLGRGTQEGGNLWRNGNVNWGGRIIQPARNSIFSVFIVTLPDGSSHQLISGTESWNFNGSTYKLEKEDHAGTETGRVKKVCGRTMPEGAIRNPESRS